MDKRRSLPKPHQLISSPSLPRMQPVSVHFLGTCSGGGPVPSRNCSSLAVDFGTDIWLFDCADGTLNRLFQSPLKLTNISRIYITHMHADHVLGLVWVLAHLMSGVGTTDEQREAIRKQGVNKKASLHIYGPAGLRELVRTSLTLTSVALSGAYAVHELLHADTPPSVGCEEADLHPNEAVGTDIYADDDQVWRSILVEGNGKNGRGWSVKAGPIEHRVPAIGYILQEPIPRKPLDTGKLIPLLKSNAEALAALDPPVKHPLSLLSTLTSLPPPKPYTLPSGDIISSPDPSGVPPRKLVIFGDCSGGTKNPTLQEMCEDPSLLVHECTNSFIPERIQRGNHGRKVRTREVEPSLAAKKEKETGKTDEKEGRVNGDGDEESENKSRSEREAKNKEEVQRKAISRGHSTPEEVGAFAGGIRARRVVVNHFSAMFPSPRYHSSSPYPSLLSPGSPFPYPVPRPLGPPLDSVTPFPLSGSELHLRMILQSIASQIDEIRTRQSRQYSARHPIAKGKHATMLARDFMVVSVPSHELAEYESQTIEEHLAEVTTVTESWVKDGGAYLTVGKDRSKSKIKSKEWVGIDPEPAQSSSSA